MKRIKNVVLSSILGLASFSCFAPFAKNAIKVNAVDIPDGQVLDSIVDTISVSDLTFNGFTKQSMIGENKDTEFTFAYSEENTNKNLVFKFKYDVKDTNASDKNAVNIYFRASGGKWDAINNLWLRGDGNYLRTSSGYAKTSALTEGVHDIEFGRVALLNGDTPTGNYYVYYKLDGALTSDCISSFTLSELRNGMFLNFSEKNVANKIYDMNLSYDEEPQRISVKDLMVGGASAGISVPNKQVAYMYDTTEQPEYKSVVFNADVDYLELQDSQIHLEGLSADNWNNAGYIWFQKDRTYFGITDAEGKFASNKEVKYKDGTLEAGSKHNIEYGRLAVFDNGEFTGRYHVYFTIDGKKIYGVDQVLESSVAEGGKIFLTGSGGFNYTDSRYYYETPKEISVGDLKEYGSDLAFNTIKIDGNTKYTYNNEDHTPNYSLVMKFKYEVAELIQNQFHLTCDDYYGEGNNKSEYIWASASSFILNNENGAKVHLGKSTQNSPQVGYEDIKYTMEENATYDVEYGRLAVIGPDGFTGSYYVYLKINDQVVKSNEYGIPAPVVEGNVLFVSAGGYNNLYDADFAPCTDTHSLVHFDAVPATCTEDGTIEYWICSNCGEYFSDSEGQNKVDSIVAYETGHNYGTPTYEWIEDGEGYKCVATAVCSHDETHVITEESKGQYSVVTPATCEEVGSGKYTATFTNLSFEAQEKVVEIAALGHHYGDPIYEWEATDDGYKCVAKMVCENDESHIIQEEAVGQFSELIPATCEAIGSGKYTATFANSSFEVQEKAVDIPAKGHTYKLVAEVAATLEATGTKQHYVCEECNKVFVLENGKYVETTLAALVIEKLQPEPTSEEQSEEPSTQPSITPSADTNSEEPTSTDTGKKKGCKGGVATSGLITLIALAGALFIRKKQN